MTIKKVLNHIIELKEDTAAIKEHLKSLNGTVEHHEKRILNNEKKLYYYGGGLAALVIAVEVVLRFF